jgi:hypothetical protein
MNTRADTCSPGEEPMMTTDASEDMNTRADTFKHQPIQLVPVDQRAQDVQVVDQHAPVEPVDQREQDVPDIFDTEDTTVYPYEITKKSFERRCFRVERPFAYAVLPKDNKFNEPPQLMCQVKVRQYFAAVEYLDFDKDGNTVRRPFMDRWLRDKTHREVTKLTLDPQNLDRKAYNMWQPYTASFLQAVPDAQVEAAVEPFILHIRDVIANGDETHATWFLDWLANMVKRPHQKSNVAILLYGKQGCGKGIILDFMRTSVLGQHCTYQTSNPERDILDKFSSGMVGRVLVQLDEVKALHGHSDVLKDLITGDTFVYEEKYAKAVTTKNYANMVFTTNNENALSVPMDDRRHVLFRCSDKYKGNEAYFSTLHAHLKKPDTARAVYQYLMGRDLSAYPDDFQHGRPRTNYFTESQKSSISPMKLFMSAYVNSDLGETVMSLAIYKLFKEFYIANWHNIKFIYAHPAFVIELVCIKGIQKQPRA